MPDQREIIQVTLKELLVGQNRDTVCAGRIVGQSGSDGIELLGDHTCGRRRSLDFTDEPKLP